MIRPRKYKFWESIDSKNTKGIGNQTNIEESDNQEIEERLQD